MRCEDYPCCGHTPDDPCERQPYDEPGYFDTTVPGNEHALCDHENGECFAVEWGDEEEFHDGGMRLLENGKVQPDCECGWEGTITDDLEAALAERAAHGEEQS